MPRLQAYRHDGTSWALFHGSHAPIIPPIPGPSRPEGAGFVAFETIPTQAEMSAMVESVGSAHQVTFLPGIFQFSDFDDSTDSYGLRVLTAKGIRGSGPDHTTFQMVPYSSTKAARVPASNPPASNGQTNPLRLMRLGWEGLSTVRHASGFTLKGTPQGHLFHGFIFYRAPAGSIAEDIRVKGIPGDMSREPGETFSFELYNCAGLSGTPVLIRRVEIDGRNDAGVVVAASGFGVNFGTHTRFEDCNSHHMKMAHGFALYTTSNLTFVRCKATDTPLNGFNFENVSGTVVLDQCEMRNNGQYPIWIATNTGSATYEIRDPIFTGPKLRVRVSGYSGGNRTQDPAAIRLYVAGVERPDLLDLTITTL